MSDGGPEFFEVRILRGELALERFGITGGARFLGIFEILSGLLILGRLVSPRLSVIGGAMGVVTFFVTPTLMLTTPGVIQPGHSGLPFLSAVPGQFLLKDLGLLAASFWVLATSLAEMRAGRALSR